MSFSYIRDPDSFPLKWKSHWVGRGSVGAMANTFSDLYNTGHGGMQWGLYYMNIIKNEFWKAIPRTLSKQNLFTQWVCQTHCVNKFCNMQFLQYAVFYMGCVCVGVWMWLCFNVCVCVWLLMWLYICFCVCVCVCQRDYTLWLWVCVCVFVCLVVLRGGVHRQQ